MTDAGKILPEDLTVGRSWRSGSHLVAAEDAVAFAREYDPQPFHLGDDPASLFGSHVASGWHTAAITMKLFVSALPLEGGLIGAGVSDLRWPRPVRPGDRLYAVATVLSRKESASRPGTLLVAVRVETFNQDEEVVQSMVPTLVIRDRSSGQRQ